MGNFTVSKKVVKQGHTLAVNITSECRLYGIEAGQVITLTISTEDEKDNADQDND